MNNSKIPITVFTGYLGSGKTTIIIDIVKQFPRDYKIVFLKNEYGNAGVDSLLLEESNIQIKEMINGCLCCILVGKIEAALLEIKEKYNPDRIIIETNGTAYPAPIALEISRINDFTLDGLINVIDCLNFNDSIAKDEVVKLQAKATDLILLNKHEQISAVELDKIVDVLYEFAPNTPQIKTNYGKVDKDLILGIDKGIVNFTSFDKSETHLHTEDGYSIYDIEIIDNIDNAMLLKISRIINTPEIWRAKGIFCYNGKNNVFNYVNGRYTLNEIAMNPDKKILTLIGHNTDYYGKEILKNLKSKI